MVCFLTFLKWFCRQWGGEKVQANINSTCTQWFTDASQLSAKKSTRVYFQWLRWHVEPRVSTAPGTRSEWGTTGRCERENSTGGKPLNFRNEVQELRLVLPCDFFSQALVERWQCCLLYPALIIPLLKRDLELNPLFPSQLSGGRRVRPGRERRLSGNGKKWSPFVMGTSPWLHLTPPAAPWPGHLKRTGPRTPWNLPVPECFVFAGISAGLCCSPSAIYWHLASFAASWAAPAFLSLKHSLSSVLTSHPHTHSPPSPLKSWNLNMFSSFLLWWYVVTTVSLLLVILFI